MNISNWIALGAGFYEGAIIGFLCAVLTITVVHRLEYTINKKYSRFGIYVEIKDDTLAAIDAINSLPEEVTLAHKSLVEAARAAYELVSSRTQESLVTNLDKLLQAEQRIKDLEFIKNQQNGSATEPVAPDASEPVVDNVGEKLDVKIVLVIALGAISVAALALAVVFIVLYAKAKKTDKKIAPQVEENASKEPDENSDSNDSEN